MSSTLGRSAPTHYRLAAPEPLSPAMNALLNRIDRVINRSQRRKLRALGYRGDALERILRAIRS